MNNLLIQLMCKTNGYLEHEKADLVVNKIYYCRCCSPGHNGMKYYSIHDSTGKELYPKYTKSSQYGDCYFYTEEETKQLIRHNKLNIIIE